MTSFLCLFLEGREGPKEPRVVAGVVAGVALGVVTGVEIGMVTGVRTGAITGMGTGLCVSMIEANSQFDVHCKKNINTQK